MGTRLLDVVWIQAPVKPIEAFSVTKTGSGGSEKRDIARHHDPRWIYLVRPRGFRGRHSAPLLFLESAKAVLHRPRGQRERRALKYCCTA